MKNVITGVLILLLAGLFDLLLTALIPAWFISIGLEDIFGVHYSIIGIFIIIMGIRFFTLAFSTTKNGGKK